MKLFITALCLISITLISSPGFAQISIPYGAGSGKVGYINNNSHPKQENPVPIGPLSFRIVNKQIWIADTVGNKILKFEKSGQPAGEIQLAKADEMMLTEDFAAQFSPTGDLTDFWVINGFRSKLEKFSPDGKKLDELKSANFAQPSKIEIAQNGKIYVSDDVMQQIMVFDKNKKLLSQIPYEWSGFVLAKEPDSLYRLTYDQESKTSNLIKQTFNNKVLSSTKLNLGNHYNPNICWFNPETNNIAISYKTTDNPKGKQNFSIIGIDGSNKSTQEVNIPIAMTRHFALDESGQTWLGEAHYGLAPKGTLKIIPLKTQ